MTIVLLILAMAFNILAQYLLKSGVSGLRFDEFNFATLLKFTASPLIWIGAVSYGCSFFFYIFALSRGELMRIAPVSQALVIIGSVLLAVFFFHEPVTGVKVAGLLLLLSGVFLLMK